MPLIAAVVLYAGTFFGYSATSTAQETMRAANDRHQVWLSLKKANIEIVRRTAMERRDFNETL
jgi:hypothetical protein